MKKFMLFLASAMLTLCICAQDANRMFYTTLFNPDIAVPGSGVAVDVAAYKGNATFVINWGQTTSAAHTSTVTIAHSSTSGGTYATITNLAGTVAALTNYGLSTNTITTYPIDLGRLSKYVKVTVAQTADTETNKVGVILVAPMKAQ